MTEFHVTWEIDLDADNPEEAAKEALAMLLDPESIAHVFDVFADAPDGASYDVTERIDLDYPKKSSPLTFVSKEEDRRLLRKHGG